MALDELGVPWRHDSEQPDDELPGTFDPPDITTWSNSTAPDHPPCNDSSLPLVVTHSAAFDHSVKRLLWQVCAPIILAIGVIANLLVLVVMTRRRMRGTSTSVYLVGMAVLDLMVLAVGLAPHWLAGANYVALKDLHPWSCRVEKFLDYTTGDAAVWVRVAFTLDRLVAVLLPLYAGQCCGRPAAAKAYIVAAVVVAVGKNFHIFWTCGPESLPVAVCALESNGSDVLLRTTYRVENCAYPEPYKHFEMFIRPWVAIALVSVGPFIVIGVCNTLIIVALVRRRRDMKHIRRSSSTASGGGNKGEQQFVQMAVMCVASTTLFLVCMLPTIVILVGRPHWSGRKSSTYAIVKAAFNLLFYVTFGANFFIYCMTGGRFRTTLRLLVRRTCGCRGRTDGRYDVYRSSFNALSRQQSTQQSVTQSCPLPSSPAGGAQTPKVQRMKSNTSDASSVFDDRALVTKPTSNGKSKRQPMDASNGGQPRTVKPIKVERELCQLLTVV